MHRSRPLLRLASNKAGMNRILKYRLPIVEYIRLAVNSGTFYDLEGLIRKRRRQRERLKMSGGFDNRYHEEDEDEGDEEGGMAGMFQREAGDDDDEEEENDGEEEEEDDFSAIEEELGLKSILHGTSVMKYPVEYEILSQYPPVPFLPNTPRRFRVPMKPNPIRPLMNHYFAAQEQGQGQQNKNKTQQQQSQQQQAQQQALHDAFHQDPVKPYEGPNTTDEYFYRILHMPPPAPVLQQKSATMVKAYAVVQKQYELMKTQGLSETQALRQVEDLLQEAQGTEKLQARAVRQHVTSWRHERTAAARRGKEATSPTTTPPPTPSFTKGVFSQVQDEQEQELEQWKDSAPGILWNQPDVLYAIATWGRRLQAVPYAKWTIGATTSLDHWIARKVLQMSEESWQALLEGEASMTSRGRDLIAVRHSLFPETMMESQRKRQQEAMDWKGADDDDDDEEAPDIRSIEELLATLGGSDFAKEYQKTQSSGSGSSGSAPSSSSGSGTDDLDTFSGGLTDDKVTRLVNELQDWRARNVERAYEEWPKDQKQSFEMWLDRYLKWLAPGESVDRTATRMALLASPPITEEKSKTFWDQLKDETDAQILLDRMLKDGPPPANATTTEYPPQITHVFWELSYEEQLQKLLDLGTLRPILEEYASETDRTKFWDKYSRILLEDVALEHLVPDPNGPIDASSLDEATIAEFGIGPKDRFRIEKVPWGADHTTTTTGNSSNNNTTTLARQKARDLYRAWNWHKASRARYEERLYQLGRLGLQYDKDDEDK